MKIISANLKNNELTDKGVIALLLNSTIKSLNVKLNTISVECQAIIQENNPVNMVNFARQLGLACDVPTLKKIGLFRMKYFMKESTVKDKVFAILPEDLQDELEFVRDLKM